MINNNKNFFPSVFIANVNNNHQAKSLSFKGSNGPQLRPQLDEDTVSFSNVKEEKEDLSEILEKSIIPTDSAEQAEILAKEQLSGRPFRIATAGYFDKINHYKDRTKAFLNALDKNLGYDNVSYVTSPSTAENSIDAITTEVAGTTPDRLFYVTAQEYTNCINPDELNENVNKKQFCEMPKHALYIPAEYSKSTATASNTFVAIGGRNTTVSDFCNALKLDHKAVLIDDKFINQPAFNEKTGKVENAPRYIKEQLAQFEKDGTLKHPVVAGFDIDFIQNLYESGLNKNILLLNINSEESIENAAKKAAHFLNS